VVSHFANAGEKYLHSKITLAWDAALPCWPRPHFLPHVVDRSNHWRFLWKVLHLQRRLKSNLVGLTIIGLINSAVGASTTSAYCDDVHGEPRGEYQSQPPAATGLAIACASGYALPGVLQRGAGFGPVGISWFVEQPPSAL